MDNLDNMLSKCIKVDGKTFIPILPQSEPEEKIENFERKTNEEYFTIHNYNIKKAKEVKENKMNSKQIETFMDVDKYNPLGKNIEEDFHQIYFKDLKIDSVHPKKYMILKIISKIYVDKYVDKSTNFICEDANKDIINISIFNSEEYFNVKGWNELEKEIYTEGKYIIVIEPNYKMLKSKVDGLKIELPSEIIILNDKEELNYFLDKMNNNNNSCENLKLLGNLMIKNHFFEKSIFYYKKALNLNQLKNDKEMEIILFSNLSEAYLKYGYNTKCVEYADICLEKIDKAISSNSMKDKDKFISLQKIKNIFRKLKALVNLRNFKKAFEILFDTSNNNNKETIDKLLNMDIVKKLVDIIKDGCENINGKYNYIKMIEEEKINFDLDKYGDYINPKIEIKSEKSKGINMIAKENINEGELLIVEKAIVSSAVKNREKYDKLQNVTRQNPSLVAEVEMFNKLSKQVKKCPLDNEKFYMLFDGTNQSQTIEERKQYLYKQEKGEINLYYLKVNQTIVLNKYGSSRKFLYSKHLCTGLWGYGSFLNHDCLPNTSHFGIGDYIFIFCVKKINKGEEITTSYYSAMEPYDERQEVLRNNWRFKCQCQLCVYQEKKNDIQYNNFIKLFNSENNITIKKAEQFEEFLKSKKYSCYELANGYFYLEKFYANKYDISNTKKFSELVTKYEDGKNYTFQLHNLFVLLMIIIVKNGKEFFNVYKDIITYLKKYTPLSGDDIKYLIDEALKNY